MKSQETKHPKILMIINEFPPTGESGVQRPLKFLKYLDRAGWQTFVVTPRKPSKTVLDPSLCAEIPAKSRIFGTFSWGLPGKALNKVETIRAQTQGQISLLKRLLWLCLKTANDLLFPLDKQIGWVPFALLKSIYMIQRYRIRNIYITGFPFSAFLVGIALKRIFGNKIYWVADYRDAWQFEPLISTMLPPWRMKIIRYWDEQVLKSCDRAVFVTAKIEQQYLDTYKWLKNKTMLITNGYDEDDFMGITPHEFSQPSLVYMGKIYSLQRPNLMPLLNALQKLENPLPLIHLGSLSEDAKAEIMKGDYPFYEYIGYRAHQQALSFAQGAAVNILLINDDPDSEGVYSGKIFELLRLGRPILALGPRQGVVKDLIVASGLGEYVHIADEAGILLALDKLQSVPESYKADFSVIESFERTVLTAQLMQLYG